jgi:hypothetical protein
MRRRAELTHKYSGGSGHFGFKHIWMAAKDIKTWLHGALQFCVITPLYGMYSTTAPEKSRSLTVYRIQ